MFEALQRSWLAHLVGESQMLTASLSAVHLLGFTLVLGAALVSNLRLLGLLFAEVAAVDLVAPASRVAGAGLLTSLVTGALLFAPRATGAARNPTFRLKLTLVLVAALVQFLLQARVARRTHEAPWPARVVGASGLALWIGAALAGCAFVLLE